MEQEIDLKKVAVKDDFWSPRQTLISKVVIPYQEDIMNDRIPGIEKSSAITNFRIAAGLEKGSFYGMVFQDSDVAKWLEGVAYSLAIRPDEELEKRADEIISIIARAQQEDGYLDTYFILKEPGKQFTNVQECHELYCAGHMMEAGVAYYETTGKDTLLDVCRKLADCIDRHFGPEEGKLHGYPGHEECELGLLRLYEATGEERYLALAKYFITRRGTQPDFFKQQFEERGGKMFWEGGFQNPDYYQNHAPVTEQTEAKGHAVRCMYLYSAVAELARLTGDKDLTRACETMFRDVTKRQMYITGGIGQVARWEGFSFDYDLPNDTAYAETCAAIGLVFFAHRMLKLSPRGQYADVMERALYNGVLSGMQLDGKRFFYVNPLEVNPDLSGKMPGYEHVLPQRPQWYACACCPPNVTRLVTSLGKYAWDDVRQETSAPGSLPGVIPSADAARRIIYSHLFLGGAADFDDIKISEETEYPWNGEVQYTIAKTPASPWTFAVRIPGWAPGAVFSICGSSEIHLAEIPDAGTSGSGITSFARIDADGMEIQAGRKDGYVYFYGEWKEGATIHISFLIRPRLTYANPKVRADSNCAALEMGPFVYCFEGIDNGQDRGILLQELRIPQDMRYKITDIREGKLRGLKAVDFTGEYLSFSPDDVSGSSPSGTAGSEEEPLYSSVKPSVKKIPMRAIPYFAWGNRGIGQMRVWMPKE